jgi:phytoene synthase
VSGRDLDAAGITDPGLRHAYLRARRLNARHGRSYYLASRLLPPAKRPHVHALYGFARLADEIVDGPGWRTDRAGAAAALDRLAADVDPPAPADPALVAFRHTDPAVVAFRHTDPAVVAFRHTVTRFAIDRSHVRTFLTAMRMDLTVRGYRTFDELAGYMHGSAAVIGLQLLPVLEPLPGLAEAAAPYAVDLGIAFQLSNFIRDVGEDLRRDRLYLPAEDLAAFGVDREQLEQGVVDGRVRRLMAHEIARAREFYRTAWPGIRLLHPTSRDCVATAHRLYAGILDAVEAADYQVLDRRVTVPRLRRAAIAVPGFCRAARARRLSAAPPAAPATPTTPG